MKDEIESIKEIRLLPPMGLGRIGSSRHPMENYELRTPTVETVDGPRPTTGYRELHPANSLFIDPDSGSILNYTKPDEVFFRDPERKIKPVCPFFEVWARFSDDGKLVPLLLEHLNALKIKPSDRKNQ